MGHHAEVGLTIYTENIIVYISIMQILMSVLKDRTIALKTVTAQIPLAATSVSALVDIRMKGWDTFV